MFSDDSAMLPNTCYIVW